MALIIASSASQASSGITSEDIMKVQQVAQTKVSPSGDNVAFTRYVPRELYVEKNGKGWSELFVTNSKGEERPFITGKVTVKSIQWSPDEAHIYFLFKLEGDKYVSLYRIASDGGNAIKVLTLKDTSISSYQISPDGSQVALLAKPAKDKSEKKLKELGFKAEVYEEGLKTQQLFITELDVQEKPLTLEAVAIEDYISAVQWGPQGQKMLVKTQASALIDDKYMKSQWHLFDLAKKQFIQSYSTEGKLGAAEFSFDGEYIAIIGAEDKHDPATGRLYLANANDDKVTEWLPNFAGHVSDIEWANKSNTLFFTAHVGTQSKLAKIKVGSKKSNTVIKAGKIIASNISISNSDKTLILKGDTAKHPSEVFLVRSKNKSIKRLTQSNNWLKDKALAKQETISIKARDGVEIDGVLIYPLNYKKGQRYPLIMTVHGGPESHDKDGWITRYSRPGQLAAARGYAVFHPNYRGSTGKGVAYSKLGQNDYAGKEFDDLIDFKNHFVETGLVDSKKVGITGGSYGGYASAWGATKLTEHFAASVMFVGIANQLSKFGTTDISNEMNLVHARSYPWDKWQWYLERSPIYWAGQSKTPLLIMHGKDDPRVHPSQSMELYRYMKVQGKDVRLVYYPGEGHGNKKTAAQYDYNLRLMRWMDHYLKNDGKDLPPYKIDHKAKLDAIEKETK